MQTPRPFALSQLKLLLQCCTRSGLYTNVQSGFVGRVLTRHVGLKPDLQEFAHKFRQEWCTTLACQKTPAKSLVMSKGERNAPNCSGRASTGSPSRSRTVM